MSDRNGDLVRLTALLDVPVQVAEVAARLDRIEAALATLQRTQPTTFVSVPEAARMMGVSLSTAWRRVRDGVWETRRDGRTVRVNIAALRPPTSLEVARMAREALTTPAATASPAPQKPDGA